MVRKNSSCRVSLPRRIFRVVPGQTGIEAYPFADLKTAQDWSEVRAVSDLEGGTGEPQSVHSTSVTPDPAELDAAYQRGLAEGIQKGRQEARHDLEREFSLVAELARQWREKIDETMQQAEVTVLRLAFEIAKKVIHSEIRLNADMIHYVVREAVKRISHASEAVVHVNPADLERLESDANLIREMRDRVDRVTFKADETVTPGGCIVETNVGLVDATLESQLEEIEKNLFGDFVDAE